jgi:hypothetical protein
MSIVRKLISVVVISILSAGWLSPLAAASDGEQQLPIKEDWIFSMRGALNARFAPDRLIVSTDNLALSVLADYKFTPLSANYITVDLVNRNPGQKGWNVVATTRRISFGAQKKLMVRGDAHLFSFEEAIPFRFTPSFRHEDHWLVLTVNLTPKAKTSGGTVHAHTKRLVAPTVMYPPLTETKPTPRVQPSQEHAISKDKKVTFVSRSAQGWSVTSTAQGTLYTKGPFLVVRLDTHSLRVDKKYVPTTTKVSGFEVSLTQTDSDGTWRIIRSSAVAPYNATVYRDDVRKVNPTEFIIPIEGIPLRDIKNYGLVLTTLVGDRGGRTYSHSPNTIGTIPID